MRKSWLVGMSIVLIALLGTVGCATPASSGASEKSSSEVTTVAGFQQKGITVTGEGKVKVEPDLAVLRLGVEAESEKVTEAYTQANEAMDKVITALEDEGIAKEDIQTRYFRIDQRRRHKRVPPSPTPKGEETKRSEEVSFFEVKNMVTAKVREIENVSSIIGAAVEVGGEFIRIHGLNFTVEETETYKEKARKKAIANAKEKAEQIADWAGVTLGEPIYISEGRIHPVHPRAIPAPKGGMGPPGPSISPGMKEIRASVSMTFSIE